MIGSLSDLGCWLVLRNAGCLPLPFDPTQTPFSQLMQSTVKTVHGVSTANYHGTVFAPAPLLVRAREAGPLRRFGSRRRVVILLQTPDRLIPGKMNFQSIHGDIVHSRLSDAFVDDTSVGFISSYNEAPLDDLIDRLLPHGAPNMGAPFAPIWRKSQPLEVLLVHCKMGMGQRSPDHMPQSSNKRTVKSASTMETPQILTFWSLVLNRQTQHECLACIWNCWEISVVTSINSRRMQIHSRFD